MAWFKVDDKLHDHRKARQAGKSAMGLWVLAGSWAADNLTDGFVPASLLSRWGTPSDARRLVKVNLWHEDEQEGEEGWRFHEWLERQPSRAQKMEEREARAKAGRIGGKASGRSRREANPKQAASQIVEPPSRPVPSPSDTYVSEASQTPSFDDFWGEYPRKIGKGQARKAWNTAVKKNDPKAIIAAAWEFARVQASTDPQFIPHPSTWLNGERWADEAPTAPKQPDRVTADQLEDPPDGLSPEEYSAWLAERRRAG